MFDSEVRVSVRVRTRVIKVSIWVESMVSIRFSVLKEGWYEGFLQGLGGFWFTVFCQGPLSGSHMVFSESCIQ